MDTAMRQERMDHGRGTAPSQPYDPAYDPLKSATPT